MPTAEATRTVHDPALDHLLAPVAAQQFFDRYWERRHLLVHRQDEDHYGQVFDLSHVDQYLALAARNPQAMMSIGRTLENGRIAMTKMRVQDSQPTRLLQAFHAGATLMFDSIDLCWHPAAEVAAVFARSFGAKVKVNVYVTPPGFQGAPIHPDIQDVFVLQTAGAKDWYLYQDRAYEPVEHLTYVEYFGKPEMHFPEEPPLAERATLTQGDLLYIPRGLVHRAVAPPDQPSVHLAVCVTPLYWVDFLKAAVEIASAGHPELSRALPRDLAADPALRQTFEELVGRLLEGDCFERAARVMGQVRMATAPQPGDGHFAQVLAVDDIGPDTVLELRRGQICLVDRSPSGATISFAGGRMDGPPSVGEAFEFVRDHRRFRVADLPGPLSDKSKLTVVRRLVREGLLRPAADR